jgi:hypothetical protein
MTTKSPAPRPPRPIESEQRSINSGTPPMSVTLQQTQQIAQPTTKHGGGGGKQQGS